MATACRQLGNVDDALAWCVNDMPFALEDQILPEDTDRTQVIICNSKPFYANVVSLQKALIREETQGCRRPWNRLR